MFQRNGDSIVGRRQGALPLNAAAAVILIHLLAPGCTDFTGKMEPDETPTCREVDLACTRCHGDPDTGNPAPPGDTHDATDPTLITVGAHQAHLGASTWRGPIACTECHRVPDRVNQPGHLDGGDAEITWGTLALSELAKPSWDRATRTCAGTYCHGATLGGPSTRHMELTAPAALTAPVWTSTDGHFDACGQGCHTNPPGGTHPVSTACAQCHGDVISYYDPARPSSAEWADFTRHVDGVVDLIPTSVETPEDPPPDPPDF